MHYYVNVLVIFLLQYAVCYSLSYCVTFLKKKIIYLLERQSKRERVLPSTHSFPSLLKQLELGASETRSQELLAGGPCG